MNLLTLVVDILPAQQLDDLLFDRRHERHQITSCNPRCPIVSAMAAIQCQIAAPQRVEQHRFLFQLFVDRVCRFLNLFGRAQLESAIEPVEALVGGLHQALLETFGNVLPQSCLITVLQRFLAETVEPGIERGRQDFRFAKRRRFGTRQGLREPTFGQSVGRSQHPERAADQLSQARRLEQTPSRRGKRVVEAVKLFAGQVLSPITIVEVDLPLRPVRQRGKSSMSRRTPARSGSEWDRRNSAAPRAARRRVPTAEHADYGDLIQKGIRSEPPVRSFRQAA